MIMGTAVPPSRINVMFALVLTPLLFTGASQYPWASAGSPAVVPGADRLQPAHLRQRGHAGGDGTRGPPHPPLVSVLVLVVTIVAALAVGIRLFLRRAVG